VGVNKYVCPPGDASSSPKLHVLTIDNAGVRAKQIARLDAVRSKRNSKAAKECLSALTEAARTGTGNLLELSVAAAAARCSVGEMSDALEAVWGRYQPTSSVVSGAYQSAFGETDEMKATLERVESFAQRHGRRPRILVAKLGQDGHDRGAKVVASSFADLGFDVDIGPLFQTPEEVAQQAIDADVHVVGLSSLAGGHRTLLPALVSALKEKGAEQVGGVLPAQDHEELRKAGAAAIFTPGTRIPEAACMVLDLIDTK
jgi:methylmalonyl-CoA mutase